jgi:hypothetical protein
LLEAPASQSSSTPSNVKFIFFRAKAFIKAAKEGDSYIINASPMFKTNNTLSSIPIQYKKFGNVFKKKNADVLLEHQP